MSQTRRRRRRRVLCDNRRQGTRFEVEFAGEIYWASLQGTTVFKTTIQDLSAQGACLVSRVRIPVGENLIVTVTGGLRFRARVARVKETGGDSFEIGVVMEPDESLPEESNVRVESHAPVRLAKDDEINHQAFRNDRRLNNVLRFVEGHYDERISLKEAAQIAAMEATYFSAFFRQKVGITYIHWLQHLRVAKAISLLENENLSITDVAYQVGFNDLRTFQRAFKKHTRLTPRALRKKLAQAG